MLLVLVAAVHLFNTLDEVAECFWSALLKKDRSSWPWDPALYHPCRFGQLQLASVSGVKERFWGGRCWVFWLGQLCVTDPRLLSSAVPTCCRLRIHAACVKVKMTSKRWHTLSCCCEGAQRTECLQYGDVRVVFSWLRIELRGLKTKS